MKNNQTIDILPKSAVRIQREKENTPREAKTAPNKNPANHKKERTKSDMLRWYLKENKGWKNLVTILKLLSPFLSFVRSIVQNSKQEYIIGTINHIAWILYSKTRTISSVFVYFYDFCKLCRFLCQHHYVNPLGLHSRFLYHFQLFCEILGKYKRQTTIYWSCNFSCTLSASGKFYLPDAGFCSC